MSLAPRLAFAGPLARANRATTRDVPRLSSASPSSTRGRVTERARPIRASLSSSDVIDADASDRDDITAAPRVRASVTSNPIVILSGFGNCSSDYDEALGNENASLKKSLERRGFSVRVVRVERKDWFVGIVRGIFTRGFWMNACTTRESYGWYLERVDEAVREALRENPEATGVDLVAHSAGGWLARAFIGGALALNEEGVECSARELRRDERVRGLVCLGTPHEQDAKSDPTRGASKWVNDTWPGAYYEPDVTYACVTGRAVIGNASAAPKTIGKYAAGSYAVVAGGDGNGVEGDAVVPNSAALALKGAEMIVVDGCWHSMSTVGTFDQPSERPWYGSEVVVDRWLKVLECARE